MPYIFSRHNHDNPGPNVGNQFRQQVSSSTRGSVEAGTWAGARVLIHGHVQCFLQGTWARSSSKVPRFTHVTSYSIEPWARGTQLGGAAAQHLGSGNQSREIDSFFLKDVPQQ